jgi:hypothetical protein
MDDLDKPKETPEQRARRKWGNNDIAKRFLAEKKAAKEIQLTEKKEPVIGKAIKTVRPKAEELTKFERRFIREIREMLEGHTKRNLLKYKLSLLMRREKLIAEVKRRKDLIAQQEAAEAAELAKRNQEAAQPKPKTKDLFS